MQKYELSYKEILAAKNFATRLIAAGKRGSFTNYFIGTLGEMGYARHSNAKVNLEVYERGVGDKGLDFNGVQVKTVTWAHSNKELKVDLKDSSLKNPLVEKYVLMYVDPFNVEFAYIVGEISKESFLKKAKINAKYKAYTVSEYDLDKTY